MKFLLAVMLVMGFVVGKYVFGASNQAGHEPVFTTIHASVHSSPVKMLFDSEIMDVVTRGNNTQLRRIVADMYPCLQCLHQVFSRQVFSFTSKHVPRLPTHAVGLFQHLRGLSSRTKPSTNVMKALNW